MFFNNKNLMLLWYCIKGQIGFLIPFVLFVLVVLISFFYLGLELADFRKTGDSPEIESTNKDKLIERFFTIIGGAIAVLGLFAVIKRLGIAEQQTKITQKGQSSERFVKSVEQLANEDLGIFLGGLASLDSLSYEGEKEYRQVWKYLGDFLRHHEPLQKEGEKPHPKVEAIAQMLKERKREEYKDFKLDLSDAHLEGADLYKADLRGANLRGANLEGAYLIEADLRGVLLRGANLGGALLLGANLQRADLYKTHLEKTYLVDADLRMASLNGAKFKEALFGREVKLDKQDLTALKLEQLRGTYYDKECPELMLPEGISEKDQPKPISFLEWYKQYHLERKN